MPKCLNYAPTACAMSCLNVSGSLTAISAMTLRSSEMPALRQAFDEAAVLNALLAADSADSDNPQPSELTLFGAAIPVGIVARLHELLIGGLEQAALAAEVAFGGLKNFFMTFMGHHTTFHAGHNENSFQVGGVGCWVLGVGAIRSLSDSFTNYQLVRRIDLTPNTQHRIPEFSANPSRTSANGSVINRMRLFSVALSVLPTSAT